MRDLLRMNPPFGYSQALKLVSVTSVEGLYVMMEEALGDECEDTRAEA
jgi:hypothetical protein